jgi:hypothetical protein
MPHYASYRGVALAIVVLLSTLATIWRMSRSDRRDAKMAFLLSLMRSSDSHLDRDSSR